MKRISPKEAGIHPVSILGFLDEIEKEGLNLHKFMMLRHGNVFAEGSYCPYKKEELHTLFSFSKSFTSTAVGFAVQDGLLSLEDHVMDFFLIRILKIWESEPEKDPGSFFLYNNRATYMLSAIVCKVTGRSMFEYLKEKLFDPLGFRQDIWWETSPQGYEGGAYGLNLTLEDMAKFGIFLMNQGSYEGKQLLNAQWFQEPVKPWSDTSHRWGGEYEYGYGYQFWMCSVPGIYRADGAFGQFCVVAPEYDLILITNSAEPDLGRILEAFWHNILPAAKQGQKNTEETSGSNEEWHLMQDTLEKRILELEINTSWKNSPPLETNRCYQGDLDGREFILEDNMYNLRSISFMKSGNDCRISLKNGENTDIFIVSAAQWNETVIHPDLPEQEIKKRTFRMGLYEKASVKGYFEKDVVLFDMVFRETPYCDAWHIKSVKEGIEISIKRNVGNKPVDFTVRGK